jgi:hypothetical protein
MATGNAGPGYVTERDPYCMSCAAMPAARFQDALTRLRNSRDLRADVFVGPGWSNRPAAPALRDIEHESKCSVADGEKVVKLVALMSALKYEPGDLTAVEPVIEIRFYRTGHASEPPVLEAFLAWEYVESRFREKASMTAIVNGQFVNVDYEHLNELVDFVSTWDVRRRNKMCKASRNE